MHVLKIFVEFHLQRRERADKLSRFAAAAMINSFFLRFCSLRSCPMPTSPLCFQLRAIHIGQSGCFVHNRHLPPPIERRYQPRALPQHPNSEAGYAHMQSRMVEIIHEKFQFLSPTHSPQMRAFTPTLLAYALFRRPLLDTTLMWPRGM